MSSAMGFKRYVFTDRQKSGTVNSLKSCFVPEHTCHLRLFHFHITRTLTKTNLIRKSILHRLEVLRPGWLFDSAKDSAIFPSPPPAIHSISFHPKPGSLMATAILGVKRVPEEEKETVSWDGLYL